MKRNSGRGKSTVAKWGIPLMIGILVSILLTALLAVAITKIDIGIQWLPRIMTVIFAIGCGISAFLCAGKNNMRGILSGLISSVVFTVIITLMIFLLCGMNVNRNMYFMIPINILIGISAGIIGKNTH